MDLKKIFANLNLAWRLILHFLRKLNPLHEGFGLQRFEKNYLHEGLPPIAPISLDSAHASGQCTVCGECDAVCPLLLEAESVNFLGPMATVISASRAAPHFQSARHTLQTMTSETCQSCFACVSQCPEQIPILDIAQGMDAQLKVINQAKSRASQRLPSASTHKG